MRIKRKREFRGYRVDTTRDQHWDYASNGSYFITINTKNRRPWFGKVIDGKMNLSPIGRIANSCWEEIPDHFPFVNLGAHIIMPDHVHGIITIQKTQDLASQQRSQPPISPLSQPQDLAARANSFGPQSRNLASIVRGYKVGVTKYARKINQDFSWQGLYHDHIIKSNRAYKNISNYIKRNPKAWTEKQRMRQKK